MRSSVYDTPVLFIVFNRPDQTKRVFEAIREERPHKLFVAADGPRTAHPEDASRCLAARKIATAVDWECDLKVRFSDYNAGCGHGPANAISWFFDHVDEGVILEDDCLPSHDFFLFCSEMLEHYRSDKRIMEMGGTNLYGNVNNEDPYSYFFSRHNMIWGWATWKRAWKHYDFEMAFYSTIRSSRLFKNCFASHDELEFFRLTFDRTVANIDTVTWWDYQWEFARRINSGLTIVPKKNLVINLGIGRDATHTTDPLGAGSDLKFEKMNFPLVHPEFVLADSKRDEAFFKKTLTTGLSRAKARVKKLVPGFILDLHGHKAGANRS